MIAKTSDSSRCDYSDIVPELRTLVGDKMEKQDIPGLAIALVEGSELVWAEGFGFTDRSGTTPVTVDTPFSIQSAGKTYTATALLMAAGRGLVALDDPLRRYYPGFQVKSRFGDREADKITFRHMLCHRSGLSHEAPVGNNYDPGGTFDEHIRSIADTWLKFPVGDRFSYSNLGMDLTAYTLQLLSGKPFAQYMQDELLQPLGMEHSTYDQQPLFSTGQYAKGHRGPWETPDHRVAMLGAGGLYLSVRDMARFVSFHLNGCVIEGKRLVDPKLLEEMYTIQYPVEEQARGYGLGVGVKPRYGTTMIWHNGGGAGYQSMHAWLPAYNLGVAVLFNQAGTNEDVATTLAYEALKRMVAAKYGSVPEESSPPAANRPIISLDVEQLRRLQGEYRGRDGTISVQEKEGALYMGGQELRPYEATGFATEHGVQINFSLDARGRPREMQMRDFILYSQWPIDHTPTDEPGPNRPEWVKYTGLYTALDDGLYFYATVTIRNGYLHMNGWLGNSRLLEHEPGLFFTVDGEAVAFEDGKMTYCNSCIHTREKDPYGLAMSLVDSDPHHLRLAKGALTRLSAAYREMGEQEKAGGLDALRARLYPD